MGKYMIRPILALERLTLLEAEGKVGYRHCEKGAELETMNYLEFIARVTSHIPDKGQVTVRYYGPYANAHRGKVRKASLRPTASVCTHGDRRCLHECGRREQGIFHRGMIWRERESGVFRFPPTDVSCPSECRMSFFVNFAGIDTANVREYIAGVVKWGVSAPGAGIRGALGKANSYPSLP